MLVHSSFDKESKFNLLSSKNYNFSQSLTTNNIENE